MSSLNSVDTVPAVPELRVPVGVIVAIACMAQFVLVLNTTIVNVALPGMHAALGLSVDGQQETIRSALLVVVEPEARVGRADLRAHLEAAADRRPKTAP